MNTDRSAEITKEIVDLLLSKVKAAYGKTLTPYEYGSSDADEIILWVVLVELHEFDILSYARIQKVLKFLPPHPEYLDRQVVPRGAQFFCGQRVEWF